MRRDPWQHREKYTRWKSAIKESESLGVSAESASVIRQFLDDMELGRNTAVGTRKGARSYARLNNLRQRLVFVTRALEERYVVALTQVKEEQVHAFFGGMRLGSITRLDGKNYRSTGDYVNVFKTFWRWHMRTSRRQGVQVEDICLDLDYRSEKAPWVYLTLEDVQRLGRHAKPSYRVLMLFLFDAGIRSPTELLNVRVRDLSADCTQLAIREETSKTFGRTIKLLVCPEQVREYITEQALGPDAYIFNFSPLVANRYLQRLALRVLGPGQSAGGKAYSRLTMYDFRHSSACYWLPRYKSESALKYRFGWKKSSMIEYYTGFLGMKDTITREDLLMAEDRTQLERNLEQTTREKALLEEGLDQLRDEVTQLMHIVAALTASTAAPSPRPIAQSVDLVPK